MRGPAPQYGSTPFWNLWPLLKNTIPYTFHAMSSLTVENLEPNEIEAVDILFSIKSKFPCNKGERQPDIFSYTRWMDVLIYGVNDQNLINKFKYLKMERSDSLQAFTSIYLKSGGKTFIVERSSNSSETGSYHLWVCHNLDIQGNRSSFKMGI